jgi:hypothetical protein
MINWSFKGEVTNQNDLLLVSKCCYLMGLLQYLTRACQPDICYTTNALSRFIKKNETFPSTGSQLRFWPPQMISIPRYINSNYRHDTEELIMKLYCIYRRRLRQTKNMERLNMLTTALCNSTTEFFVMLDNKIICLKSTKQDIEQNCQQNQNFKEIQIMLQISIFRC